MGIFSFIAVTFLLSTALAISALASFPLKILILKTLKKNISKTVLSLFIFIPILTLVIASVSWNIYSSEITEWNPTFPQSELIGQWEHAGHQLIISRDYQFLWSNDRGTFQGQWSRDDWNIYFRSEQSDSGLTYLRAVKRHGNLFLAQNTRNKDPDTWSLSDAFTKKL
jgi:energy-coupling factor transporter transmembrane protein EcfT